MASKGPREKWGGTDPEVKMENRARLALLE